LKNNIKKEKNQKEKEKVNQEFKELLVIFFIVLLVTGLLIINNVNEISNFFLPDYELKYEILSIGFFILILPWFFYFIFKTFCERVNFKDVFTFAAYIIVTNFIINRKFLISKFNQEFVDTIIGKYIIVFIIIIIFTFVVTNILMMIINFIYYIFKKYKNIDNKITEIEKITILISLVALIISILK